jgi:kumamolisin
MRTSHVDLPGNNRPLKQGARRLGPADPDQLVRVTVVVRGKHEIPEPDPSTAPMSLAEVEQKYGADSKDIERVKSVLSSAPYGLKVIGSSPGARTVELEGTVSQMNRAFDVDLGDYEAAHQGKYRGREGDIRIPAELSGIVGAVLGLDERQVAKRRPARRSHARKASSAVSPQRPADLESRYSFPEGGAANQKIGILEFGGGYWESDLAIYCKSISGRSQPNVAVVPVGLQSLSLEQIKAIENPQQQDNELDASVEVNMDVQVVAGLCPAGDILVYFAPFTQKGWENILQKAVHDPNGPRVISVSWGSAEDSGDFSPAALKAINNKLKTAALVGTTICVASGDDGAGDSVNDGKAHCDFPSSSPYVLAVGGTMFPGGGADQGWWEKPGARTQNHGGGSSGGGRSTVFPTPSWQNVDVVSVRTGQAAGRCIPDVSALSGAPLYDLIFDAQVAPNGGTSASAPLWASLLARIAGNLPAGKQVGFVTPLLYQPGPDGRPLGASAMTDVLTGENDDLAYQDETTSPAEIFKAVTGYQAEVGYDAVSGWGVPIGKALQAALSGSGSTSVAHSLFAALPKGAGGPRSAAGSSMTHDPYAALLIDHDFLNDQAAKQSMLSAASRIHAWTDIPFPSGTAPAVLADSASESLPAADVVLITYTTDEANAMAAVLTPGFLAIPPNKSSARAWKSYTHDYASYVPDLLRGSSPALDSHNLGLYKLVRLGTKRVLCFKSSLHLARDGTSIPIMRLVQQIHSETGAGLIITTGTAGGIGASVQLGDAAITTACRFDLVRMFASEPFNGTTVESAFKLQNSSYLDIANATLVGVNASRLKSSPIPPKRTPMIASGTAVFGGDPNVCVTTDAFLYDDAENTDHLQGLGCLVEMDDAVVGLAVQAISTNRPNWLAIRNASDPQMPAGASKQESSDIYMDYGFYTTFTSVLACWACVLGS